MFSGISELFTTYMMQLLDFLRSATGSYGLAIIVFATLVKLVLYYPTQSQYKSMKDMQKLQPEMKKLQAKYKGDQQRIQTETMALYKRYKINPLGGCLPLIIQMPILIGIFVTIRRMAELGRFADETFLWIGGSLSQTYDWIGQSLADKDIPLLILYGVSMFLSQRMTPSSDPSAEKTQQLMSYAMPVMFIFFLWNFPSSLILYWLVFNILSIGQQYLIMRDTGSGTLALQAPEGGEVIIEQQAEDEHEQLRSTTESPDSSIEQSRSRSRKKKGGKTR